MTELFLIRHAHSAPSPTLAEAQWPLSERGRRQAIEWIAHLRELRLDHIYSSPYVRALATVSPSAQALGLQIEPLEDLWERCLSHGMLDDFEAVIRHTWEDFSYVPPGGETSAAAQERARRVVHELCLRHPGQRIAISSHGNLIGLYLNSIDESFGFDAWRAMSNPDLFHLSEQNGHWSWVRPLAPPGASR